MRQAFRENEVRQELLKHLDMASEEMLRLTQEMNEAAVAAGEIHPIERMSEENRRTAEAKIDRLKSVLLRSLSKGFCDFAVERIRECLTALYALNPEDVEATLETDSFSQIATILIGYFSELGEILAQTDD